MTSNFSASIPAANMQAANDFLNNTAQTPGVKSYGPNNFSVPAYAGPSPSVALLHAWGDDAFEAAVASIPNVTITQGTDPIVMTKAAADAKNSKYNINTPLPATGTLQAEALYRFEENLWYVIQTFDRTVYSAHPSTYPSLICRIGEPGVACAWWQPLYSYDAPRLANVFTGKPDQRKHNGFTWKVTQADGAGNNVWEPGVFGWTKV